MTLLLNAVWILAVLVLSVVLNVDMRKGGAEAVASLVPAGARNAGGRAD